MGVDYFLVSRDRGEVYELGRAAGLFHALYDGVTEENIRADVVGYFLDLADPEDMKATAYRAARDVIQWCQERDWKVELMSDAEDAYAEVAKWPTSGALHEVKEVTMEDIRRRLEHEAEKLAVELGLDYVRITGIGEEVNFYDSSGRGWEIEAVSAYDEKRSGYRRVVVQRVKEGAEDTDCGKDE